MSGDERRLEQALAYLHDPANGFTRLTFVNEAGYNGVDEGVRGWATHRDLHIVSVHTDPVPYPGVDPAKVLYLWTFDPIDADSEAYLLDQELMKWFRMMFSDTWVIGDDED